jgi:hypothetical protein
VSGRTRLPNRRAHELVAVEHAGFSLRVGAGRRRDGQLAEIFIDADKIGTQFDTVLRDLAIVTSIALQCGADAATIRRALAPTGPLAAVLDRIEEARR